MGYVTGMNRARNAAYAWGFSRGGVRLRARGYLG